MSRMMRRVVGCLAGVAEKRTDDATGRGRGRGVVRLGGASSAAAAVPSSLTTRFGLRRRGWYRVPTVKQRIEAQRVSKGGTYKLPVMDWMWVRCLHGLVASQNGALTR
nr:hypothetical protein B3E4.70 [imported] - Neurospora crassa [Neurospora crassa]